MANTSKRIAIIGSTGSVGRQGLEIIAASDGLGVCGLAAGSNWRLLAEQAKEFRPDAVSIADEAAAEELAGALPDGVELLRGADSASELIRRVGPEMVLTAAVGSAGLAPTLAAIECGADLAVANKESLVIAGQIVMPAARSAGVNVLPVDSEHSGIFQCMFGHDRRDVRRVTITASGGPFRTWPIDEIRNASLAEVLDHPTWRMGPKVTIDSATMMNKALEIIEAHWLFGLSAEQIRVVIHPESVVHACVEFSDGSLLAQMGAPSMTTPIAFALHYPRRAPEPSAPLDLAGVGELGFSRPDPLRCPALELGYEVVGRGGTSGAVLNAANEAAVEAFVAGRIEFGRIVEIVQEVLNRSATNAEVTLETLFAAAAEARRQAEEIVNRKKVASSP